MAPPDMLRTINWSRWALALALPAVVVFAAAATGGISWPLATLFVVVVAVTLLWLVARQAAELEIEVRRAAIRAGRRRRGGRTSIFLANLVEGMSDPLILLGTDQRIIHANRAARQLFGVNILGQDIAFYLRHPAALKAIEQAISEGVAEEQEITLLDPVERSCLIRVTLIDATDPDRADEREPQHYLVISIVDVTKMKLAEKMRVDFVANVSHELRTPLASIIGFVETLLGPAASDEQARARFLNIILAEAQRMQRLINDLLSLSRIEMDQHLPPRDSVDLGPLLRGLAQTLELGANGAPILQIHDGERLPQVRGDRDQLVQVFQNLIDNAVRYGRAGEPVEVRFSLVEHMPHRAAPGLAVAISNKGDGIPPEHIPRLTERFYRVDTARSRKLGGTGLGLAIVKHILNRHRGALGIKSTVGRGTTVTVYLPLARAADAAEIHNIQGDVDAPGTYRQII